METQEFQRRVFHLAASVPPGKVASYGQLALLAGCPQWSRKAGKVLQGAPGWVPCHRIVNSQGRLVPFWAQQRVLLAEEGVVFKPNGCVDMRRCRYDFMT